MKFKISAWIFTISILSGVNSFVIGLKALAVVGSAMIYGYCYRYECCDKTWIKFDETRLLLPLRMKLYGQHQVFDMAKVITGHIRSSNPNKKPLVISFNGPTGTGKNYATNILIESIFVKGRKSKFIKEFICTRDFYNFSDISNHQKLILREIETVASRCQTISIIIIDEADKCPPHLLDVLKPLTDNYERINSVSYRNSIFILRSNAGQEIIAKKTLENAESGKERTDFKSSDVEALLRTNLYSADETNGGNGFYKSYLIEKSAIDHYFAFLPLEKKHVEMCIKSEMISENKTNPNCVDEVLQRLEFFPKKTELYSAYGCKRVPTLVASYC